MHYLCIFFHLFVFLRVSQSLDYSDLEALGVSCPQRDSCARIKSGVRPEERNCECDSDCSSYGDCCIDATYRRPRPSSGIFRDKKENVICLNYGQDDHTGVYAVARCRSGWKGSWKIRRRCEGSPPDQTDVPVTNVAGSVTYKNLFCAQCNDADSESLQAFHIRMACDGLGDTSLLENQLFFDRQQNAWGVFSSDDNDNRTFTPCDVTFELPDNLKDSVRFCRSNVVAECAEDWTDRATRLRCGRYTAVVHDAAGRAYKNPHCALCNHQKLDDITCSPFISRRKLLASEIVLDPNKGDSLGMSLVDKSRMRQCLPNHLYDPFFQRCRRLVCALPNHHLVEGRGTGSLSVDSPATNWIGERCVSDDM